MNVESIIDKFISSEKHERQAMISRRSDESTYWSFLEFMKDASKQSVIQNSKDLLIKGLYANIIEGGNYDMRDNLTRLTLLYHSAMILGLNPQDLFQEVADDTDGNGKDLLISYLNRPARLKTLKCMGYRTTKTPEFDYVWDGFNSDYVLGSNYSEATDLKLVNSGL